MRIEEEIKLDFQDVLIRPKRSLLGSRREVDLQREYTFLSQKSPEKRFLYGGIPIIASNMDGVGTFEVARALGEMGLFTCLVKTYSEGELTRFFQETPQEITKHVAVTIGINPAEIEAFSVFYKKMKSSCHYLCVEVANGYTERFTSTIADIRKQFPDLILIAGNVVTSDQTQELILKGADIVKVGIGPGSVCTTRLKTGVGYPQLSAIIECADAAHGLGGHIISDGGCTCPGDVVKAFAGGADFVMLGGLFAGHEEGGGEVISRYERSGYLEKDNSGEFRDKIIEKQFVEFYGMSSAKANDKHFGGLQEYRSSEGREVLIPFKGAIKMTANDILGGLRSACTYVGASTLKQLTKCTSFIRVAKQYNDVFEKN